MHRDETLGFKLQIRHFRSNRKELPPQGRARKNPAAEAAAAAAASAAAAANNARIAAGVPNRPLPSNRGQGRGGGRDMGANRTPPYAMDQQPWGPEAYGADEARWHCGVKGNGGPGMDHGGGGGERWTTWDYRLNDTNATASDRDPHRYGGHNTGGAHPPQHAQAPLMPGLAQAPSSAGIAAAHRTSGWDGPSAGRVWGDVDTRAASSWHSSAVTVDGRGEGFERMAPNGVGDGEGGARGGGFAGGRREQQSEADVRAAGVGNGYFHQPPMEQQQHPRVPPGGAGGVPSGAPAGFMHGAVGIDGPVRGGSPDSSSTGAPGTGGNGALLHQGYRRLAAMADERAAAGRDGNGNGNGNGNGQPGTVLNQAQHQQHSPGRPPLPHQYDGPVEVDLKRSVASVMSNGNGNGNGNGRGPPGVGGHGQFSSRPLFAPSGGGGEDGPAKKKRRPSMDGGERASNGSLPQHQQVCLARIGDIVEEPCFACGVQRTHCVPCLVTLKAACVWSCVRACSVCCLLYTCHLDPGCGRSVVRAPIFLHLSPQLLLTLSIYRLASGVHRTAPLHGPGSKPNPAQADASVNGGRSSSNERRAHPNHTWQRGVGTPPGSQGDVLARELAESERQLLSARYMYLTSCWS